MNFPGANEAFVRQIVRKTSLTLTLSKRRSSDDHTHLLQVITQMNLEGIGIPATCHPETLVKGFESRLKLREVSVRKNLGGRQ